MQGFVMTEPKDLGFVLLEPRDPVAYPKYPEARPITARRPRYVPVEQDRPKDDAGNRRSS